MLAPCLAACGPVKSAGDVVATAPATVAAVRHRYEKARTAVAFVAPFLPADRQARLRELEEEISYHLDLAGAATTMATQAAELRRARAAIAELDDPTG